MFKCFQPLQLNLKDVYLTFTTLTARDMLTHLKLGKFRQCVYVCTYLRSASVQHPSNISFISSDSVVTYRMRVRLFLANGMNEASVVISGLSAIFVQAFSSKYNELE